MNKELVHSMEPNWQTLKWAKGKKEKTNKQGQKWKIIYNRYHRSTKAQERLLWSFVPLMEEAGTVRILNPLHIAPGGNKQANYKEETEPVSKCFSPNKSSADFTSEFY